jgi:cytochrome c peroxidase
MRIIALKYFSVLLFFCLVVINSCSNSSKKFNFISKINEPSDNPSTEAKIALGKALFFDKRLSINETVSCASCHDPKLAFTDQKQVSEGVFGRKTTRNSQSILNAGFLPTVMFDGHLETLEKQVIVPIQEHTEMAMDMLTLIKKLSAVPEYQAAAKEIFQRDFDPFVLTRSISAFERSLISMNSRFDQYYYQKKKNALTQMEISGWKLFSEKLYCTKCHPAPYFTTYKTENNGIYADYELEEDKGRFRIHNDSNDIGFFKIPSLRNIELTYPYMHDGSVKTLEEVIQHYMNGGKKDKRQSKIIVPFKLKNKEILELKAFLNSLTDTLFIKNYKN